MILITRPKAQSKELKLKLTAKGFKIFHENFYSFKYYRKPVSYKKTNYYIFPSIHAVNSLKKNKQISKFKDAKIFAIGEQVSKVLSKSGCKNIISISKDSKTLLKTLQSYLKSDDQFIYFCSNIINEIFFVEADKHKINIKKIRVYKTIAIKSFTKKLNNSFALNNITGITFYSKLAVDTFLILASKKILKQVRNMPVYCISDRVAKPLIHKHFKSVYIAKEPNERSLIASINKKHFIAR
jgi:uroporphyrinogen-III synthase